MFPFLVFSLFLVTCTAQREGEPCVDQYANTVGRCTVADQCESAKNDFQLSGIRPTFCTYNTFGATVVCCRDGSSILQSATTRDRDQRPIWGTANNANDGKRVSERKCEEYSRGVVEKVPYIPLIPDPEPFSVTSAKCDYTGVELIVGGENANPGEFPHMAAIGWADFGGTYKFSCGGSLISPRFVLTAAHCSRDPNAQTPEPVIVRLGDQNIDNDVYDGANPVDVAIRTIHKHPDYDPPRVYNDIALLELVTDVKFRAAIRAACLWTSAELSGVNKAVATGWGVVDTRTKQTAKELQKVSLSILDNAFCNDTLVLFFNRNWHGFESTQMCAGELRGGKDTCQLPIMDNAFCNDTLVLFFNRNWHGFESTQMCAGELRGGKDTCQGDSGSPLQIASKENSCIFRIIGVTSFGRNCAEKGRPAVYTRVASYIDWIESVVWPGE